MGSTKMLEVNDDYSLAGVTRPLRTSDFARSNAGRPAVLPITLAELAQLEPSTLFASPAWLTAYGVDNLVAVSLRGPAYPLLFAVRDRHLVHLGRLLRFEAVCLSFLTDALLKQTNVDFVVFEDVEIDSSLTLAGSSTFRYQRNWQVVLDGEDGPLARSTRSISETRRKKRALERHSKEVRVVLEDRPSQDLMRTVVELNKAKVESTGRKHGIDDAELDRLWSAVSEIGHLVILYADDRVIAGDLFCVVGRRAYAIVSGYDMTLGRYSPGVIAHDFLLDHCRRAGLFDLNLLWGDSPFKRHLGAKPRELVTVVARRSPAVHLKRSYLRAAGPYYWFDFKARVRPFIRRRTA